MKIYFLSATPCALTLNGVFYGVTDRFERFAEVSLSDKVYAKFSPEGAAPIGFFITDSLSSAPPEGCEVYLLADGIAVYAYDFPPTDFTLRLIDQKRQEGLLITAFCQGKPQLSVEGPQGFFTATLPPSLASCSIKTQGDFILLRSEKSLGIYTTSCKRVFLEEVLEYSLEKNELNATMPLSDSLRRVAKCRYRLADERCILTECTLQQSAEQDTLPEGLLAYAFFESVLLKADYLPFLCEDLQKDAPRVVEFLGDYISVTLTKDPNICGLVYKKAERVFTVEYFTVQIENGKITDVRG